MRDPYRKSTDGLPSEFHNYTHNSSEITISKKLATFLALAMLILASLLIYNIYSFTLDLTNKTIISENNSAALEKKLSESQIITKTINEQIALERQKYDSNIKEQNLRIEKMEKEYSQKLTQVEEEKNQIILDLKNKIEQLETELRNTPSDITILTGKMIIDEVLNSIDSSGFRLTYDELRKVNENRFSSKISETYKPFTRKLYKNFEQYDTDSNKKLDSREVASAILYQ